MCAYVCVCVCMCVCVCVSEGVYITVSVRKDTFLMAKNVTPFAPEAIPASSLPKTIHQRSSAKTDK